MKNYSTQTLLAFIAVISLYILIQVANLTVHPPSATLIALAVRATIEARPTLPPLIVQVPMTVEVTRIVGLPLPVEPTVLVTELPSLSTPLPLPIMTPTSEGVAANNAPAEPSVAEPVGLLLSPTPIAIMAEPTVDMANGQAAAVESVQAATASCTTIASSEYKLIPMEAAELTHPDRQHGDLNLALRGTQPSDTAKEFITYSGPVDVGAPQLTGLFADHRQGPITSVYQVRDWLWDCGEHGCAGDWLTQYPVTLVGIATTPGEAILFPTRDAEIYGGGYVAVVLYADTMRLTIAYTRDGTVANGYAAHLENLCVDPNLLALYRAGNAGGRHELPGLYNGQPVGVAVSNELMVAIRDRGAFMDPRSEHDWWHSP